MTQGFVKKLTI